MNKFEKGLHDWKEKGKGIAPIIELLNIQLVEFSEGKAVLEMHAYSKHHNAVGTVHGGIFCDLGDVAMGCALASVLEEGLSFTTMELAVNYLQKVVDDMITASAYVVHRGKRRILVACDIHDSNQKLVANLKSTCLVMVKK